MIYKILRVKIGSFYGNSVNKVDLNFTTTVSCDVSIAFTSITLGGSTNFGRVLFGRFATVIFFLFLKSFFREEDEVLDLLNWEEEYTQF